MKSLILFVLLLVWPALGFAEGFRYEDEAGNIYFADTIAEIPMRYRNQVIHTAKYEGSAKDLEKYNKKLEQIKKKQETEKKKAEVAEAKRLEKERKEKEKEAKARAKALKKKDSSPDKRRSRKLDPDVDERQSVRIPND
jgi:hypothetical protein